MTRLRPPFRTYAFRPSRLIEAAQAFIQVEASGGIVLVIAAVVALCWVNSPWGSSYEEFWHTSIVFESGWLRLQADLRHAVNDGLMAAFSLKVWG